MALTQSETSLFLLFSLGNVASVTFFKLENRRSFTVWPGIHGGNGITIFLMNRVTPLMPGSFIWVDALPGWSGRFWGRTGCIFDGVGNGKCATGDCTSGLTCTGRGTPPVTEAEFTIGTVKNETDLYKVSMAEGYNIGVGVTATRGTGDCQYAECSEKLMNWCSITCTCSYADYVITFCPRGCSVHTK